MTADINSILKMFRNLELPIPTLYIMGDEDEMFLPAIRQVVKEHVNYSQLAVIPNCGHVVNVEKPDVFNRMVCKFIDSLN